MTPDTLCSAKEFMKYLGIKKSKFYECVNEGKLLQPIKLTMTRRVWPLSVINQVVERIKAGELCL